MTVVVRIIVSSSDSRVDTTSESFELTTALLPALLPQLSHLWVGVGVGEIYGRVQESQVVELLATFLIASQGSEFLGDEGEIVEAALGQDLAVDVVVGTRRGGRGPDGGVVGGGRDGG